MLSQSEIPEDKISRFLKLRSWHSQSFRQQQLVGTAEGVAMQVTGREEVVVNILGGRMISLPIRFQPARGGGRKGNTEQGLKDDWRKSGGSPTDWDST